MDQQSSHPELREIVGTIVLIGAGLTLPGLNWSLFGWMHLFLPLLVFFVLVKHGLHGGGRIVFIGGAMALVAGIVSQPPVALLLSFSLVPCGYVLARCGLAGKAPAAAGLRAAVTLGGCWLLLIGAFALASGTSPYGAAVSGLNSEINQMLQYYHQSGNMSAEMRSVQEATLTQMKMVVPIVLPAMFASMILFTTWITMVLGNRLLMRYGGHRIWSEYRFWQLPDALIWAGIGSAVLAFLPMGPLRFIGINMLITLGIVYAFQGMAICVYAMNRWRVPLLLRSFLYVMIIFQAAILLLVVGVADTWFDFRKLNKPA